MSILLHKEKEHDYSNGNLRVLSIVRFMSAMGFAFISTIWAIYVDSFFHNISYVGFLSGILTLVAFISYFLFIPLIEKEDKAMLYKIALMGAILGYVLLFFIENLYLFIFIAAIIAILGTLRVTSFGIMLKDNSKKGSVSKNVGLMYVFANIAWFLGPVIAGLIVSGIGIRSIFLFASGFLIFSLIIFDRSKIIDVNKKKSIDKNPLKNFIGFFKSKDRTIAYIISGGVDFWLTIVYLFMPLLIIRSGLEVTWVGYFLGASVIPLITLEFMFSKMAAKVGFKRIFQIGFFIIGTITILGFFIQDIYALMGIIILANVGVAMVEPTTESYFFNILKKKEALQFYGPYNTTSTVGKFLSKIIPSAFLLIFPFKSLFLIFGGVTLGIFFLCFKIRDVIEEDIKS